MQKKNKRNFMRDEKRKRTRDLKELFMRIIKKFTEKRTRREKRYDRKKIWGGSSGGV